MAVVNRRGFTLLELVVVIALLGIMLVVSIPRLRLVVMTNELKTSTRKIVGLLSGLRDKAVRDNKDYILHVEIGGSRFWVGQEDVPEEERMPARETGFVLPPEVKILDVWLQSQGKQVTGEVLIRFNRKGYVEKSIIHLGAEGEDRMSILLLPFLSEMQTIDRYVEPEL